MAPGETSPLEGNRMAEQQIEGAVDAGQGRASARIVELDHRSASHLAVHVLDGATLATG